MKSNDNDEITQSKPLDFVRVVKNRKNLNEINLAIDTILNSKMNAGEIEPGCGCLCYGVYVDWEAEIKKHELALATLKKYGIIVPEAHDFNNGKIHDDIYL